MSGIEPSNTSLQCWWSNHWATKHPLQHSYVPFTIIQHIIIIIITACKAYSVSGSLLKYRKQVLRKADHSCAQMEEYFETVKEIYVYSSEPYSGKYWRTLNLAKQLSKVIGELKFFWDDLQVHALPIRVHYILKYT